MGQRPVGRSIAARLDLNLLRVFDAVMRHRSIAAAGRELHLTPSAISHALGRLRASVQDPLFVAVPGGGMTPTERASTLAPAIRDGLGLIESGLQRESFFPGDSRRSFRIGASDYAASLLLPLLSPLLIAQAPGIECRVVSGRPKDLTRSLDSGLVDVVLDTRMGLSTGPADDVAASAARGRGTRCTLWEDDECIVVRAGHPMLDAADGPPWPVDHGRIDVDLVEGTGRPGRPVLHVAHIAAVLPVLRHTDLISVLPRRSVTTALRSGQFATIPWPTAAPGFRVEALWTCRGDQDAGIRWLIERMCRVTEELRDGGRVAW